MKYRYRYKTEPNFDKHAWPILLTYKSWSWDFHELSCLWRACDVEKNVVVARVHVRCLQGGAPQQGRLAFRHFQQHVGDEERWAVILGQYLDWEFVSRLMATVGDSEDDEVFDGVAVIVVISDLAPFDIVDGEHEAFSICDRQK